MGIRLGKIIQIMGKSGSGKDTIMQHFLKSNPYDLKSIILHSTRPIRDGEMNGREYFFDSNEEMLLLKEQGKIVELRSYNTVYGIWHYYTCSDNINLEKHNYITVGTLEAYDQYCSYFGKDTIVPILVDMDGGSRIIRAVEREKKQRNQNYKELCRRFMADEDDFSHENIRKRNISDLIDNNGTIEDSVIQLEKIVQKKLTLF